MNTDKLFNEEYERLGLVESDVDPTVLRGIFDAGFRHGHAAGFAAAEFKDNPGAPRQPRRNGFKKVSPDDPRPASEKQRAFVEKLLNQRCGGIGTPKAIELFRSIFPQGFNGLDTMTTGQASLIIDQLLAMRK